MEAIVIQGLAWGDEGKGSITDYLVRANNADLVVRYNGGCQAAHNVITPAGVHHTFSQFGSGTLAGARTYLSEHMLIEPSALAKEATILQSKSVTDPMRLISINPESIIITPFHRLANRILEALRGDHRHGSVGVGVGEARGDALEGYALKVKDLYSFDGFDLLAGIAHRKYHQMMLLGANESEFCKDDIKMMEDLLNVGHLRWILMTMWRDLNGATIENWEDVACKSRMAVFEGAQGFLLDEKYGTPPYNSWTDCTFGNALSMLNQVGVTPTRKIGILRSYYTRHGAGPFPTEDSSLHAPELHNKTHPFMGPFRIGHFDAYLAGMAIELCRPTELAITHMDCRPSKKIRIGELDGDGRWSSYNHGYLPDICEDWFGVQVVITSHGPTALDKSNAHLKEQS